MTDFCLVFTLVLQILFSHPDKYRKFFCKLHDVSIRSVHHVFSSVVLRVTAGTAIARLSHRNSVCLSVHLSVCHTGGSVKNGAR